MIFIRVDSNPVIASGHVMRCIAVAQAFRQQGGSVMFVTADENPLAVLQENGFPATVLHSDWQDLEKELPAMEQLLSRYTKPLLLVDTYSVTRPYVERLSRVAHVCYLGSKQEYLGPLAAAINYTGNGREFYESVYGHTGTRLYLGPAYAPLRLTFQNIPLTFPPQVSHVLLTTGNTDARCVTERILQCLLDVAPETGIQFDVVVGSMFCNRETLHARYDAAPRVTLHEHITDMRPLMQQCQLAVSANGTTVYELAACGVPAITFAMVPEQLASGQSLGGCGVTAFCGLAYTDEPTCLHKIQEAFLLYTSDAKARHALAQTAHSMTDGNGSSRIASVLRPFWAE